MIDLKQSVQYIKGVGPSRAKLLSLLGVNTVEDLINYYPRTYEDVCFKSYGAGRYW